MSELTIPESTVHINRKMITLAVMLGTAMSSLDSSIVNVTLPYMQGNLGASVEAISWVATAYILANIITMPIIAMISARFGRKNFFLFSLILFVVSSMMCGFSWNLESMIFFRVLQGIGGGTLIPVAQAVLREIYPPEEQGRAMGIYGLGVVLGPACGPVVGGWLTDNFSWPWIFHINVPIGIVAITLTIKYIHDPVYFIRERKPIDWSGLFFMILGLGALQLMLEEGERNDWFESNYIVILGILTFVGLALFIWRELTTDIPAVDLRVLSNLCFLSGTAIGGILGLGLNSSLFLMPQFLQNMLGYNAFSSGLALMPRSLAMAIIFPIAGVFYNRLGPQLLIAGGLLMSVFSFYQLSNISLSVGYWSIFWPQFMQGIGFGLIFVALSTAALATIEKNRLTAATGLYSVTRQVFGSIGIAIFTNQLTVSTASSRAQMVWHVSEFSQVTRHQREVLEYVVGNHISEPVITSKLALKILESKVISQARMLAFNHVFMEIALCFMIGVPLVLLLRSKHAEFIKGELD